MADETLEWDLKVDADTSGGTKMDAVLQKVEGTVKRTTTAVEANEKQIKALNFELERLKAPGAREIEKLNKELEHLRAHGNDNTLTKIRHEFGQYGHAISYAKNELKELAEFAGLILLAEGIKEVTEKIVEMGEELLKAAAGAERTQIAFTNSMGAEDAEATLGYIEKIGHHTEFTQHRLKDMNLELSKSGFKGADLARANEAIIDLASMSANPEAGADAGMGALKRLMTSGKLDARALRPFGINQKTFFDELSKETGVGVVALKKQMDKGKVDVGASLNSLYTVITAKTGKALGGAGADMEKTFNVRLKNLKEIPELLGEKLQGSRGFASISDFVGRLADEFSPDSPNGRKIVDGLTSIIDEVGDQLKGIDLNEVTRTITNDLIPAVKSLASSILFVVDGVERLIRGFHRMKVMAFGADFDEGPEVAARRAERREKNNVATAFPEKKADLGEGTKVRHGTFHMVGADEAAGLAKALPGFEEAGKDFGGALEKGFRKKTKTHSPSELFAELGRDVAAGFSGGVEDSAAMVDGAFRRMTEPALPGAGRGGPGAGGGLPPIQFVLQQKNEINGGGGDMESIPDQIAKKTEEIVPGMIQSALEQMAMQTGGS